MNDTKTLDAYRSSTVERVVECQACQMKRIRRTETLKKVKATVKRSVPVLVNNVPGLLAPAGYVVWLCQTYPIILPEYQVIPLILCIIGFSFYFYRTVWQITSVLIRET